MSTRSKYVRQNQEHDRNQAKQQTDIIMKFSPTYGKYISRALKLFFGQGKSFVTIKAAERVIDRALWVAEIIKRRVPDLHQIITISQNKIVDVFLPKQQGLLKVQKERFLTVIEVTLTRQPTNQQKKAPGYQGPIKVDASELLTKEKWEQQQKERQAKQQQRKNNRDNRDNKDSRDHKDRDNNERGGQRRRGRGGNRHQ